MTTTHDKTITKLAKENGTDEEEIDIEGIDVVENTTENIGTDKIDIKTIDAEASVVPDSTTTLEKEPVVFNPGEDVLLKHKDGRYYLGTVVEFDYIRDKCLLRFGDNTESWSPTKKLTKLSLPEPEDLLCVVCKKSSPKDNNDVAVCDKCGRGYHLLCHQPAISPEYKNHSNFWHCKKCVESRKKASNIYCTSKKSMKKAKPIQEAIRKLCSGSDEIQKIIPTERSKLPYDPDVLNWDTYHRVNMEKKYCYCGKNGDWYTQMLQCGRCRQWFHEKCVSCLQYPLYCGDRFYVFVCSICNYGKEFLRRLEMKWVDMVHLMIFNLTSFNTRKYYDLDTVIIPYINDNWHALQLPPKIYNISKSERRENVLSILTNNRNRFKCGREIKKRTTIWGLRVRLPPPAPCVTLPSIGPITDNELRERWHGNRRLQFLPRRTIKHDMDVTSLSANVEMIVPVDSLMINLMMGVAYQIDSKSDSESPCPSPIIEKPSNLIIEKLDAITASSLDTKNIKKETDTPTSTLEIKSEDADMDYESPSPVSEIISKENTFQQKSASEYEGAGFVKRSVPFPQKPNNMRRKRLLTVNGIHDKMLRRHKILRKLSRKSESGDSGDTRLKKVRRLLRNRTSNIPVKNNLPPTPPTSVSAPPTPPSNCTNPLQSTSEISSDGTENLPNNLRLVCDTLSCEKLRTVTTKVGELPSAELNTLCDTSGDETSSKSTLDLIIPPPKDFEGRNNPFHLPKDNATSTPIVQKSQGNATKRLSLPLSLTPVAPLIRTLKRQLSEKDICIGPNGEVKQRRRYRRTRSAILHAQQAVSKNATVVPSRTDARQLRSNVQPITNCVDYALNGRRLRQRQDKNAEANNTSNKSNNSIVQSPSNNSIVSPVKSEPDIDMDDLKSSVNIYFGAANRIASGEKFNIRACRLGPEGRLQYLLEWDDRNNQVPEEWSQDDSDEWHIVSDANFYKVAAG